MLVWKCGIVSCISHLFESHYPLKVQTTQLTYLNMSTDLPMWVTWQVGIHFCPCGDPFSQFKWVNGHISIESNDSERRVQVGKGTSGCCIASSVGYQFSCFAVSLLNLNLLNSQRFPCNAMNEYSIVTGMTDDSKYKVKTQGQAARGNWSCFISTREINKQNISSSNNNKTLWLHAMRVYFAKFQPSHAGIIWW